MKHPKQQVILGQAGSKYLPVGKNKILASALLRVSEKTSNQEINKKENVVYCGDEEPFNGWTSVVPNPRYSEGSRPKPGPGKKRKLNKKVKSDLDKLERKKLSQKNQELTAEEIERNHTYATLRDMYDHYKQSIRPQNLDRKSNIFDPETFQYIPWNERKREETENGKLRLPTINMVDHPAQTSKLLEVLEKFGSRNKELFRLPNTDAQQQSKQPQTKALDHLNKFRWNFEKEIEKQESSEQNKKLRKRKHLHVHLPSITSQRDASDNLEPSVQEKLVRFVNGTVYRKLNRKENPAPGSNASYINIQAGQTSSKGEMVRLERKKGLSYQNGRPEDHWVARVIIKEPDASSLNQFKQPKGFKSASSVIIVPDARWKRKLGVIEAERERIQKEMERIQYQQQQEIKLNQLRKRLLQNISEVDLRTAHGKKRKQIQSYRIPPVPSVVETPRVSVKYNVETMKRKRIVHEITDEDMITPYLPQTKIPAIKPTSEKINLEAAPTKQLNAAKAPRTSASSPESKPSFSEPELDEDDVMKQSRLFLNRGAAKKKKNKQKKTQKNNKAKLPPILSIEERSEITDLEDFTKQVDHDEDKISAGDVIDLSDDTSDRSNDITSLPEVVGASATFHTALNNGSPSSFQSPARLTTTPDQARAENLEVITKKTPRKSTKYLRYKVVEHPGTHVASRSDRKPLHPTHLKNRGQEKIQDMIEQEKEMLASVIDQMGNNWKIGKNNHQTPPVPQTIANGGQPNHVTAKHLVIPSIVATPGPSDKSAPGLHKISRGHKISGDVTVPDDVNVTSQNKVTKRKRVTLPRQNQEHVIPKKTTSDVGKPFDEKNDLLLKGDVIMRERATSQLIEPSFAASISSVKPSRRVVNIIPQSVMQKA